MDAPSIPSASKLVAEIAQTRRLAKVVRSRARKPTKAIEKIAWAALTQADELAEGIRRLVRPTALCRGAGLLARTMWEGVVTLDYIRRRPRSRVRQLRVEGLLTLRAIKKSAWGQEIKEARLSGNQQRCIARARKREAQYRRERKAGAKSGPFDVGQYAALPSMRERAHDVDAVDQYDFVYRLESIASAHWTSNRCFRREVLVLASFRYWSSA